MQRQGPDLTSLQRQFLTSEKYFAVEVKDFWHKIEATIPHFYQPGRIHFSPSAIFTELYSSLSKQLTSFCDGLYLALGVHDCAPEIIITANGNPELFPSVSKIVSLAPQSLRKRSRIYALRPARHRVKTLNLPGIPSSANEILYTADTFGKYADMNLFIPGFSKASPAKTNDLIGGVFLLLDYLLGEYFVATKLRLVTPRSFEAAPRSANSLMHIHQHLTSSWPLYSIKEQFECKPNHEGNTARHKESH